jgi:hypothetical protein
MPRAAALAVLLLPLLAGTAAADCTCRAPDGSARALGERICMSPDGAPATFRCSMVQNVTSWRKVADGCPAAALAPSPDPDADHPAPAATRLAAAE